MLSTLCAFFTLVVALWFFHFKWKRKRLVKMMEQFDGPPVYPVIGNCLEFVGSSKGLRTF